MINYKNKYLKYKNKYINLKNIIGGTVPKCLIEYHKDDISNIKTIILSNETYLFHGNSLFNNLDISTPISYADHSKRIKFFNTTYDNCSSFALDHKLSQINIVYIGIYKIILPIKIYAQNPAESPLYADTISEYKSKAFQCLCDDDYNGYCSYYIKDSIKYIYDIGLCNYNDKIELIGYVPVNISINKKIGSYQVYKYNKDEKTIFDSNDLLLIDDNPITLDMLNVLNQDKIDKSFDTIIDIKD